MLNDKHAKIEKLEPMVAQQLKQIETLTGQLREKAEMFTAQIKDQAAEVKNLSAVWNRASPRRKWRTIGKVANPSDCRVSQTSLLTPRFDLVEQLPGYWFVRHHLQRCPEVGDCFVVAAKL